MAAKHKRPMAPTPAENASSETALVEELEAEQEIWRKCLDVCLQTHPKLLPCFTLADFNVFSTANVLNFVVEGCPALKLYNEKFGLQKVDHFFEEEREDLRDETNETEDGYERPNIADESKFFTGAFVDECVKAIANFLAIEFPNPLEGFAVHSAMCEEVREAVKEYIQAAESVCLAIPALLNQFKSTVEEVVKLEESLDSVLAIFEDSEDTESFAGELLASLGCVGSELAKVGGVVTSGFDLIRVLRAWAKRNNLLLSVEAGISERHARLMQTKPILELERLQKLHRDIVSLLDEVLEMLREAEECDLHCGSEAEDASMNSVDYSTSIPVQLNLDQYASHTNNSLISIDSFMDSYSE